MKIYKCVHHVQLEHETRQGWTMEQVLAHDHAVNIQHTAPAQVVNNNQNSYSNSGNAIGVDSPVIVREPMFLLSKESEVETRENQLLNQLTEGKKLLEEARENLKPITKERDSYKEEADSRTKQLNIAAGAQQKIDEARRKLEADMGKIRQAIGDLKYFEIVGGPTSK